jgi:hypothetical protein
MHAGSLTRSLGAAIRTAYPGPVKLILAPFQFHYLCVLVAGVAADLQLWRFRPSAERLCASPRSPHLQFSSLPYFLILVATGDVSWPVGLWTGSIALAGVTGLLLSYWHAPDGGAGPARCRAMILAVVMAIAPFPFEAILTLLAALAVVAVGYIVGRRWW